MRYSKVKRVCRRCSARMPVKRSRWCGVHGVCEVCPGEIMGSA